MQCGGCKQQLKDRDTPCPKCQGSEPEPTYVVNELLCYVSHYNGKCPADSIKTVLEVFYHEPEMDTARECVKDLCKKHKCLPEDIPETRRGGTQRTATTAKVDDIVKCVAALDQTDSVDVMFVGCKLNRIPTVSPEEATNMVSQAERISKLEFIVGQLVSVSGINEEQSAKQSYSDVVTGLPPKAGNTDQPGGNQSITDINKQPDINKQQPDTTNKSQ